MVMRFTPTCVGKTAENITKSIAPTGSPPRVWGKPHFEVKALNWMRFTPTCVGKTVKELLNEFRPAVHPHVCGENGE